MREATGADRARPWRGRTGALDPSAAVIDRAEALRFGDLVINVVTTEDLIGMKRLAAVDPKRHRSKALRDQADIALLEGDVPGDDEGW